MNLRPARTFLEFISSFKQCILGVENFLGKKGYHLEVVASLDFPPSEVDDLEAGMFGCKPEYCIYNKTEDGNIGRVTPPYMPEGSTFRSCGGHIHIGHPIANIRLGGRPANVVKLMDALVGVMAILLDKDPSSLPRRKLYGGAGSHRVTPYGVEYRTLSNFWLNNYGLANVIYKLTRLAVEYTLTRPDFIDSFIEPLALQKLINTSNQKDAGQLYEDYKSMIPYDLQQEIEFCRASNGPVKALYPNWAPVTAIAA